MSILSLGQAEDLAVRTLAAIDRRAERWVYGLKPDLSEFYDADRKRIASDLAGLRWHTDSPCSCCDGTCGCREHDGPPCPDRARYAEGLLLTAALYGVTL